MRRAFVVPRPPMRLPKTDRHGTATAARSAAVPPFVLLAALGAACVDPGPYAESPVITTEVEDWRDEIIYQLMVDRFANGDVNNDYNVADNEELYARYLGGDYQGVIDNVAYLEALGVTAVWVSPIVVNVEEDAGCASYHGYWTQDFLAVNPHFGDLAKFREMVEVLHEHGIVVILDIVVNHVGQLFYYDINRNGQPDTTVYGAGDQDGEAGFWDDPIEIVTEWDPAYDRRGVQSWTSLGESGLAPLGWVYMPEINRFPPNPPEFFDDDWYNRRGRVTSWFVEDQVVKGDFPGGLKDLDTSNPEVVEALIEVEKYWIEETNIDGFRIDTLKHVEHEFWREFAPAMRQHAASLGKERFLQFGEAFDGKDELIGSYTFEDEMDSVFYFSQKWQVFDDVFAHGGPTTKVQTLFRQREAHFGDVPQEGGIGIPPQKALVNFMDNHDVPRFLFVQPNRDALKAALVFLLTEDGIPCIYYGTEQGFSGGNDPANREPLWWTEFRTDGDLFRHVAGLTALRKERAPLRRGNLVFRWVTDHVDGEEDAHVLAFERTYEGEKLLVAFNTGGDGNAHTAFEGADMEVGFAPGTTLVVAFPEGDVRTWTVSETGTLNLELAPYEALVLVPAE